jgi:uncharacterized protein (TIRG00374 family)
VSSRFAGRLLRILVAAGLTGYVLYRSHPAGVLQAAAGADLRLILLAVALVLVDRTLMAYRWLLLLCTIEPSRRPPLGRVIRIFFVSTFVGTFLPASIGGDAVRAYSLAREQVAATDAIASVFMDRALGVASILMLGGLGLLIARDLAATPIIRDALAVTALLCLGVVLIVFSTRVARLAVRVIESIRLARLHRIGIGLIEAVQRYAHHHGSLLAVLATSLGVQLLRVAQAYLLGRSLGIELGFGAYVAYIPLILLVMLLPITVNGLGTSQAAFVWFFARSGVAAPAAFTLSVLFVALGVVGNLPGGLLYATGGVREAAAEP